MAGMLSAVHTLDQLPFNVPTKLSGAADKISSRRSTRTSHSATATNPSNSCPRAKPTQKIHRYRKLFPIPIPPNRQPSTSRRLSFPRSPVQQHLNKSTSNRQNGSRESLVLAPPELRQGLAQLVRKQSHRCQPRLDWKEGRIPRALQSVHALSKGARGGIFGPGSNRLMELELSSTTGNRHYQAT